MGLKVSILREVTIYLNKKSLVKGMGVFDMNIDALSIFARYAIITAIS